MSWHFVAAVLLGNVPKYSVSLDKTIFAIERTSRLDQTMECGAFFDEPLLFFQSRTIRLIGPRGTAPLTRVIRIRHRFGLVPFRQRCFEISCCMLGMEKTTFRVTASSGACKNVFTSWP
jgi:hypothetical protein